MGVRVPAAFDDESFIGKAIVFAVTNSCGLPGMTQQTKRVTATLLAGDVPPGPTPPEPIAQTSDGQVKVMSVTDGGQSETFAFGHEWTASGEGFTDYPNATLDIGMSRYVEGELTPETLTIPIHLTVE